MTWVKIGRVSHYYDKIKVAIVSLDLNLTVGDKIKFVRGGEDLFKQKVDSIQVEHEQKQLAQKGDVVGIKTERQVKDGAEVFKEQ